MRIFPTGSFKCLLSFFLCFSFLFQISGKEKQASLAGITLLEKNITLKKGKSEYYFYSLADADVIEFHLANWVKELTIELSLWKYSSGSLFNKVCNPQNVSWRVIIPVGGFYVVKISNNTRRKQSFSLKINRIPSGAETEKLNSEVTFERKGSKIYAKFSTPKTIGQDTVFEMVEKDTRIKVKAKSHYSCVSKSNACNKEFVYLILPPHTRQWAYYLVVGQEAKAKLEQSIKAVLKTGIRLAGNLTPKGFLLAQFAKGLLEELPTLSGPATISYFFCDKTNFEKFIAHKDNYERLPEMKYGTRITDYGLARQEALPAEPIYLCLENQSLLQAAEVFVTVVALRVLPIYAWEKEEIEFLYKKRLKNYVILNAK
jgi:hypothetical protein